MKETHLRLPWADLHAEVLPRLRGRVFHVTCAANVPHIAAAGAIHANADGRLRSAFGFSVRSFFRLRGSVSVFDYRAPTEQQLDASLSKCAPWQAARQCDYQLAIFFLATPAYPSLESSALWRATEAWSEMIVPYVEAGHPGSIPLTSIDELLHLVIDYEPTPLERALLRTSRDATRRHR